MAEPDSDKAELLRDDHRAGVVERLAPDIFPAEIASSLPTAQRRGRNSDSQAPLATCPVLHETRPLLARVGAILASVTSGARVSLYDVLNVALVEREGCDLITADDGTCERRHGGCDPGPGRTWARRSALRRAATRDPHQEVSRHVR